MLRYNGKLNFDVPLNDQELEFLTDWQNKLVETNNSFWSTQNKNKREEISEKFNAYAGINFDPKQRWAIFYGMNPMIHFHKDYIELNGQSKKGNLREVLLAYHHFFIGKDAVFKECMDLQFLKEHNFSGIIESYKRDVRNLESRWCYVVNNNDFKSVDSPTIKDYQSNPNRWPATTKEDTFYANLVKYFPPLLQYARIKKSVRETQEKLITQDIKPTKRLKV